MTGPTAAGIVVGRDGSGVTATPGFRAAGVAAGLKSDGGMDVAVVLNDGPEHTGAAVLTANRVQAAPVVWTRRAVADGTIRAVVMNSGGANACTGKAGDDDVAATASAVADRIGCEVDEVAVCSTGLIGVRLPMPQLLAGVDAACSSLSFAGGAAAARAIMTTDTRPKTATVTAHGITVSGMAKGAGMLAPGLATMLAVLTTDASVTATAMDAALRTATAASFDLLDSDGCMSTNDTVLALASGASGRAVGRDVDKDAFTEMVTAVCRDLSLQLLADAEGASKQIEIVVREASTSADAVAVARSVAGSNLFKCAVHGEDPNWGRVLAALGTTDAVFEPAHVDVAINGVTVAVGGSAAADSPPDVDMSPSWVTVEITLGAGDAQGHVWTTDLTAAYVHENSAYSS